MFKLTVIVLFATFGIFTGVLMFTSFFRLPLNIGYFRRCDICVRGECGSGTL